MRIELSMVPEKSENPSSELLSKATTPSGVIANWMRAQENSGAVFIYFNLNQGGNKSNYVFHPQAGVELFKWPHAELSERHVSRPYVLPKKFRSSIMRAIAPSYACEGMTMTLDENGNQMISAKIVGKKGEAESTVTLTRINGEGVVRMNWQGFQFRSKDFRIEKGGMVSSTTPYARMDCVNLVKSLVEEIRDSGFEVHVAQGKKMGEDATTSRSAFDADGYFRYLGGKTRVTIGKMLDTFKESPYGAFVGHTTGHLGMIYWKHETPLFEVKPDLSDLKDARNLEIASRALSLNLPERTEIKSMKWANGELKAYVKMPDGKTVEAKAEFIMPQDPTFSRTFDLILPNGEKLLSLQTTFSDKGKYSVVGRALHFLNSTTGISSEHSVGGISHLYDEPLHRGSRWGKIHAASLEIIPQKDSKASSSWLGPTGKGEWQTQTLLEKEIKEEAPVRQRQLIRG